MRSIILLLAAVALVSPAIAANDSCVDGLRVLADAYSKQKDDQSTQQAHNEAFALVLLNSSYQQAYDEVKREVDANGSVSIPFLGDIGADYANTFTEKKFDEWRSLYSKQVSSSKTATSIMIGHHEGPEGSLDKALQELGNCIKQEGLLDNFICIPTLLDDNNFSLTIRTKVGSAKIVQTGDLKAYSNLIINGDNTRTSLFSQGDLIDNADHVATVDRSKNSSAMSTTVSTEGLGGCPVFIPSLKVIATRDLLSAAMRADLQAQQQSAIEALTSGADPNAGVTPSGGSPLMAFAGNGALGVVQKLLDAGADPNFQGGPRNSTPAFESALYSFSFDTFDLLKKKGANLQLKDTDGHNVLFASIIGPGLSEPDPKETDERMKVFKSFAASEYGVRGPGCRTPLMEAAGHLRLNIVNELLKDDKVRSQINSYDAFGATAYAQVLHNDPGDPNRDLYSAIRAALSKAGSWTDPTKVLDPSKATTICQ